MGGTEGKPTGQHEFRALNALRDAVPTRRHAEMLFEMVVDLLGDAAWVESWNGEATRTLYRRESKGSNWILPWPLISFTRGGREGPSPVLTAVPGVYEEPPVRPGAAPRLRGLGPGSLDVHDGSHRLSVAYGGDGRWFEGSRSESPDALSGVVAALAEKNASPVEQVAAVVAGLDIARHGPGRVHLPVRLPGGVACAWHCGLYSIREALFHERVPRAARWVAADGWTGGALAWGATREAAMAAWKQEVARLRPFPQKPKAPPEPIPESSMETSVQEGGFSMHGTIRAPSSDTPWVEPTLENSPAAVLALGDFPPQPPSLGGWTWLVGATGTTVPAALRLESGGFTLLGDQLLQSMSLPEIEKRMAEADVDAPPRPEPPPGWPYPIPEYDSCLHTYRLLDEKTGAPVTPSIVASSWSEGFRPITLDGERLRRQALRLRPVKGPTSS